MRLPALLVAITLAGAATAQPAPETVDVDVLYGLLGIEDPSALDVGGVPGAELQALMPDGATVLATIMRPLSYEGDEQEVVLGRVVAAPKEAADAYAERTPAGWSVPGLVEGEPYGFVSNDVGDREDTAVQLCPDDGSARIAQVRFDRRPGGGSYVTVYQLGSAYATRCDPQAENDRMLRFGRELPALRAPAGMRLTTFGSSGGRDHQEQSARLRGEVSLEKVSAHFGAEMEAAGWTERTATLDPDLAASVWTRDADSGPLTVTLTARPDGPDEFDLRLVMLGSTEP